MGASTYWKPQGLSRPVMGLLYLYLYIYLYLHLYIKKLPPPIRFEADGFVLKYYDFEGFYVTVHYSIELRQLYYIILTTPDIFRYLPYARK